MVLLTILLPLANFLIVVLFGRLIKPAIIATFNSFLMLFLCFYLLTYFKAVLVNGEILTVELSSWVSSDFFQINWKFSVDVLTYAMFVAVLTVSTSVHFYSIEYMRYDAHFARFMSYLSLFTFFMLLLITASNLIILFLGWEGVGLCSYLLIGFWSTRIQASKAAIKAMVINRVSDAALIIGIATVFFKFRSLSFGLVFGLAPFLEKFAERLPLGSAGFFYETTAIACLLFLGAMGKSAQLGLHTWLPDAMEGPTPVSALIHAATMVTAGVFLIVRCSSLFELSSLALFFMLLVGSSTAFAAATVGVVQNDIKKIIAYSTCSQLGYMVLICGLSGYAVGLFHLVNHAFFKALLFLSAGSLIHGVSDEQDLRRFGGLTRLFPFTYAMFIAGSVALTAAPFTTGFYSKDLILELTLALFSAKAAFAYCTALVVAMFTSVYSVRLLLLSFFGSTNSSRSYLNNTHEANAAMATAVIPLGLGGVFWGYIAHELFVGVGSSVWGASIHFSSMTTAAHSTAENLPITIRYLPLVFWFVPTFGFINKNLLKFDLYYFFYHKWHFDNVYNSINNRVLVWYYRCTFLFLDKGLFEYVGPRGASALFFLSSLIRRVQTGRVYDYAGFMLTFCYTFLVFVYFQIPKVKCDDVVLADLNFSLSVEW